MMKRFIPILLIAILALSATAYVYHPLPGPPRQPIIAQQPLPEVNVPYSFYYEQPQPQFPTSYYQVPLRQGSYANVQPGFYYPDPGSPKDYSQYVQRQRPARPVVSYPAPTNSLETVKVDIPQTPPTEKGCFVQTNVDITDPNYLSMANKQCQLNNPRSSRCQLECLKQVQSWWKTSRSRAVQRNDACNYIDYEKVYRAKDSPYCEPMMFECAALNAGTDTPTSCEYKCRFAVVQICQGTYGSGYLRPDTNWAMYLRSEYKTKPIRRFTN